VKAFFEKRDDQIFVNRTKGYGFPLHLHPHLELIILHSGSIQVTVSAQSKVVAEGGLAVIFPNQVHGYDNPSPDSRITMLVIDLSFTGSYMDTLLQNHPADSYLDKGKVHENVLYAFEQLFLEYEGTRKTEIYFPFIQLILARLMQEMILQSNRSTDQQQLTWQIANYVNEHYREQISLESMADALGMCKYNLSRLFSEKTGQSFPAYLTSIRLSYACSLLKDSKYSVTEISEGSGFGSLRTFFRVFSAEHGMTPMEFRKICKSDLAKQAALSRPIYYRPLG
jgi:AraC-like DNA-binding protein